MTQQVSSLMITLSSEQALKNAQAITRALTNLEIKGVQASKSTDNLGKSFQSTNSITQNFNTTINNSTNAINKQTKGLVEQEKQLDRTAVAAKQFASFIASYITINSTVDKMDMFVGLQNRLKLVTNSQTELNQAMTDTFAIAQKTRQSWDSAAQVYQKFQQNADKLGLSMSEVARISETVSKGVAISGTSADSANAAMMQLGQALASGVLRGEEFNSVNEQANGVLQVLAKGLGVAIGDLRKMANEGKLTTDVLAKGFANGAKYADELFSKTDITIGQSLTLLNNELSKFVGEAGQSSGSAKTLADSIQVLSQNLAPLADTGMILGIGYLTKSMLEKVAATRTAIVASAQSQAAIFAEKTATVELTGIEALRARQNVALATQEVRSAELALINTKGKDAQALATQRLTAAEVAHGFAIKQSTVATAQYTLAQDALNKAQSLGSKILTLVGGPIGALTLAAMGLGAGFMYMQKRADEANKKLEEQAAVAKKAKDELLALQGLEKDEAVSKMTAAFKLQNEALAESSSKINMQLNAIERLYKGNKDVVQVVQDARNGTISMNDAISKFNELRISKEVYNSIKSNTEEFVKNATEATNSKNKLSLFGYELELTGRKAQTSALGIKEGTAAIEEHGNAAERAKKKLEDFNKSLLDRKFDTEFKQFAVDKGYTKSQAEELLKTYKDAIAKGFKNIPKETGELLRQNWNLDEQLNKTLDARNEKEKIRTKELERQVELNKLVGISELKGLRIKSPESIAGGKVRGYTAEFAQLTQDTLGDRLNRFTSFNDSYHEGTNSKHATGNAFDFTVKNAKEAKSAINELNIMAEKYGFTIKTINEYASPSKRSTGGHVHVSVLGFNGSISSLKDARTEANMLSDLSNLKRKDDDERLKLQAIYYSFSEKDEADHLQRVKDLHSNGLENFVAEENERYAKTKELRQFEFTMEVDGWRWVGEEKIKNDFYVKKLRLQASADFSKKEKAEAITSFEEQRDFELTNYKLMKDQQLIKSKEFFMSELQLVQVRYDIEQRLLAQSNENPQEKEFKRKMLELQNQVDMDRRLKDASMGWDSVHSQMNGSSARYQINQDRFNRLNTSQTLFDTQIADVERQEKEPGADLQKLAEVREQIWQAHNQRMIDIENQYQKDSVNLQLTQAQQLTGSFANMFRGLLGESSGAYRTMYQMQQGFAITQASMNLWSSASSAYTAEPGTVWNKMAAAAKATLDQGTFLAMIQSITPQGFYTGGLFTGDGHVRGAGTETSDSINARLSDYEFVTRAWAVKRIGVENMEYMNRTGELPFQREYEALKMQFLMPSKSESIATLKDDGLVGVSRMSNSNVERRQFEAIKQNSQQASTSSEPNIVISQTITFDTSNGTAAIDTQGQKDVARSLNNMMDAWARRESGQNGVLYRIIRAVK